MNAHRTLFVKARMPCFRPSCSPLCELKSHSKSCAFPNSQLESHYPPAHLVSRMPSPPVSSPQFSWPRILRLQVLEFGLRLPGRWWQSARRAFRQLLYRSSSQKTHRPGWCGRGIAGQVGRSKGSVGEPRVVGASERPSCLWVFLWVGTEEEVSEGVGGDRCFSSSNRR